MKKLAALIFAGCVSLSVQAADKVDWKACDKEIKQYSCKGSDKEIWACLEKHDDKLSQSCQKTHEKGDKLFKK